MAWCRLEDTYHDDPKFRRLAVELGLTDRLGADRAAALARGFVSSLWSWAARHAPDGYLRSDGCSTTDVERICGWPTAGGRLVAGLLASGFLERSTDGQPSDLIIHRFWERAESNKVAQRKRKQREQKSNVTGQSRPPDESSHGNVPPRGERGEEKRGERGEETANARAPEVSLTGINHPEVHFFEASYRKQFGGPSLTPYERAKVFEIVRRCGEAGVPWQSALDFYAGGFDFSGHTVDWLHRNMREVLNKLARQGAPDDIPF
jgi:hypothetical protein